MTVWQVKGRAGEGLSEPAGRTVGEWGKTLGYYRAAPRTVSPFRVFEAAV